MSRVGSFLRKNVRSAVEKFTDGGFSGEPPLRFLGHVDRVELSPSFARAVGWTQVPEGYEGSPPCLLLNGRVVGHVTHQFERADLRLAGLGPSALGFSARLLRPLSAAEAAGVRLALAVGRPVVEQSPPEVAAMSPGVGAIDVVEAGRVVGWVYVDPSAFAQPALFLDEHCVGLLTCDIERPDVKATGLPASRVGFSKELLDTESAALRDAIMACFDGDQHHVSIRLGGQEIVAVDARLALEHDGRLDAITHGRLRGWAVTRSLPKRRVKLDVLCDGEPVLTLTADQSRPDIARAKLSDGRSGFDVSLPVSPSGGSPVTLAVHVSGTSQRLQAKTNEPVALPRFFPGGSVLTTLQRAEAAGRGVTVIVPVYNAPREVAACLASVERHTRAPYRLVVIDDASTDPGVAPLLAHYEGRAHVTVVRRELNQGFTRNVNLGIELAGRDDVVFLNSDTEVTPGWLRNLRLAAYSGEHVGTATALSNAAGAFSVPEIGVVNDLPAWMDLDAYGRLVTQSSAALYPRTPTGNGFCLYVRRSMLDEVGTLDEAAFPRGYGEENDLCMRAVRMGFVHVVDDRTFVYHVRSASFGEQKHALMSAGRAVVEARYPEYPAAVAAFTSGAELAIVRARTRHALHKEPTSAHGPRPRVLFVTSTQTGGTPQTNQDLMSALDDRYEALLLRCDATQLYLYSAHASGAVLLEQARLLRPIDASGHISEEYDEIVARWLVHYAIELVHVRHIAWHSLTLTSIVKRLGLPLVFSLHDFYMVCPSVKLLDQDLTYCGGTCTAGIGEQDCSVELWSPRDMPPLKHRFIHAWRAKMERTLRFADCLVTTSEGARNTVRASFPGLADQRFEVIEHGRDFPHFERLAADLAESSRIRILFPGNISIAKGASLVARLLELDHSQLFEFHVLGDVDRSLAHLPLVRHGRYERKDFGARVAAIRPHFGAIFSIWPETYCHTLTELWAAGVPVIAMDMGAVGERIREHGGGWLLTDVDPERVYEHLVRLSRDVASHAARLREVDVWQRGHGREHDTRAMARGYASIYRELLSAHADTASTPCVAVLAVDDAVSDASGHTPSRLRERARKAVGRSVSYERVHWAAFASATQPPWDAVLVEPGAVPVEHVEELAARVEALGIPLLLDVLDRSAATAHHGPNASQRVLERLARVARAIVVPHEGLAQRMQGHGAQVHVVPSALNEALWLSPLPPAAHPSFVKRHADERCMLVLADRRAVPDVHLLSAALAQVRARGIDVRALVVGPEPEAADGVEHLPVPAEVRDHAAFVLWLRQQAAQMDLALAPRLASRQPEAPPLGHAIYGALGLPTVFSDIPGYRESVRAGVTGLLVQDTADAWARAILSLLDDTALATGLAAELRAEMVGRHRLGPTLPAWDALVAQLAQRKRA